MYRKIALMVFLSLISVSIARGDCFSDPKNPVDLFQRVLDGFNRSSNSQNYYFDYNKDDFINSIDLMYWQVNRCPSSIYEWLYYSYPDCDPEISEDALSAYLLNAADIIPQMPMPFLVSGIYVGGRYEHELWGPLLYNNTVLPAWYNFWTPVNCKAGQYYWDSGFTAKPRRVYPANIWCGEALYKYGDITDWIKFSPNQTYFCGYNNNGGFVGLLWGDEWGQSRCWISYIPMCPGDICGKFIPVKILYKYELDWKKWGIGVTFIDYAIWANGYTEPKIPDINEVINNWLEPYNFIDYAYAANIWDGNLL